MSSVLSGDEKTVHVAMCELAEGVSDGEWRRVDMDRVREKLADMGKQRIRQALNGLALCGFYQWCNTITGKAYAQVRDPAFQVIA